MKKKICIITSSRAEYGLLRNLIKKISIDKSFKLQLVVSGTHLSKEYGFTKKKIVEDKIFISKEVKIVQKRDNPEDICKSFALATLGFSDVYKKLKPDCIIFLGDRYEILAASYSALIHNIPKIHLHGGELTEGIIDDATRHSITKTSDFHFVSHQSYKKRVIQLGENPKNVFLIGAMAIENIKKHKTNLENLKKIILYKKSDKILIVTLHPINLNNKITKITIENLLKVLNFYRNFKIIFTYPNQDTFGKVIIRKIKKFIKKKDNCFFIKNLGTQDYFSLIKVSRCIIGNSSSGIIEVPSFKKPSVNIGSRQRGRITAPSVFSCDISKISINKSLKKALKFKIKKSLNPFEIKNINASSEILKFLKRYNFKKLRLEKRFYDH